MNSFEVIHMPADGLGLPGTKEICRHSDVQNWFPNLTCTESVPDRSIDSTCIN